mgnify:FL=1
MQFHQGRKQSAQLPVCCALASCDAALTVPQASLGHPNGARCSAAQRDVVYLPVSHLLPSYHDSRSRPHRSESPRWLAAHGRYAEALDTIANVHAGGDIGDPYVLAQWSEIRAQLIQENLEELSFMSIFQRRFWRRLFLACSVQMWCQLSGINALMYYIVVSNHS